MSIGYHALYGSRSTPKEWTQRELFEKYTKSLPCQDKINLCTTSKDMRALCLNPDVVKRWRQADFPEEPRPNQDTYTYKEYSELCQRVPVPFATKKYYVEKKLRGHLRTYAVEYEYLRPPADADFQDEDGLDVEMHMEPNPVRTYTQYDQARSKVHQLQLKVNAESWREAYAFIRNGLLQNVGLNDALFSIPDKTKPQQRRRGIERKVFMYPTHDYFIHPNVEYNAQSEIVDKLFPEKMVPETFPSMKQFVEFIVLKLEQYVLLNKVGSMKYIDDADFEYDDDTGEIADEDKERFRKFLEQYDVLDEAAGQGDLTHWAPMPMPTDKNDRARLLIEHLTADYVQAKMSSYLEDESRV